MSTNMLVLLGLLITVGVMVFFIRFRPKRNLPPGPKGILVFSNVFDIPKTEPWLAYQKWSRNYDSDIIYLSLAGTPLIVLNSNEAATDLLERKSAIYSDRPRAPMLELMGCDWIFSLMQYGDNWRTHRRMFHQFFHPAASMQYQPKMTQAARNLLLRLLDTPEPDDFTHEIRFMAGATILDVVYGFKVKDEHDPAVVTTERAMEDISTAGTGAYLVNLLPIIQHLPTWFPGTGFKRQALAWKKETDAMVEDPFDTVKQLMQNGKASPSVSESLLDKIHGKEDIFYWERVIKSVTATACTGGADTTVSILSSFVLAMVLHPEIQRKAYAELSRVVDKDRLPLLSDQPYLPYITAIVNEILRWRPVLPIGVPHRLTTDDVYKGYHLPAGSMIIANAWAMLHDERVYANPESFIPERWLTADDKLMPDAKAYNSAAFGFGRRICAGRYFAEASIWINVASMIAAFEIIKSFDGNGCAIEPTGKYTTGVAICPEPFKCRFKPRSAEVAALVRSQDLMDFN